MLPEEYENIFKLQTSHWWYRSMDDIVMKVLSPLLKRGRPYCVLDAGCGVGGTLNLLKKNYPQAKVIGMDLYEAALGFCRRQDNASLLRGSVEFLPFSNESIDVVLCLDVLYHLEVKNDLAALGEFRRVLKKGGHLLIHVPAFEILRGSHDRVVFTRQRYTAQKLKGILESSGLRILKQSYRNMFIAPAILFKRAGSRLNGKSKPISDLRAMRGWMNNLMYFASRFENSLVRYLNLPFGTSLFCLAEKVNSRR